MAYARNVCQKSAVPLAFRTLNRRKPKDFWLHSRASKVTRTWLVDLRLEAHGPYAAWVAK
jgi:hypothetical protein